MTLETARFLLETSGLHIWKNIYEHLKPTQQLVKINPSKIN